MITATFYSKQNALTGFSISGHALFDDFGNDIVCASVSSAVQLVCNSLTEVFLYKVDLSVKENCISLLLQSSDEVASKLISSLLLHLSLLAQDYPSNIKVVSELV